MLTCSQGALRPLSPSYLHKILELLLMHLVSLSQPHNSASVLELCRSLEYEHEVRREVTLQVMRWFGEVDAADELWKMDVEKVVRQVGLGILRRHKVGVNVFHPSLILIMTPILVSERPYIAGRVRGRVEYRRRRRFCFPHLPQITHRKLSLFPSRRSPFSYRHSRGTTSVHLPQFPQA